MNLSYDSVSTSLLTLTLDGAQHQGVAVVVGAQGPGLAGGAASPTAGVVVRGLTDDDLALQVYKLVGSQEFEGLEGEAGVAVIA